MREKILKVLLLEKNAALVIMKRQMWEEKRDKSGEINAMLTCKQIKRTQTSCEKKIESEGERGGDQIGIRSCCMKEGWGWRWVEGGRSIMWNKKKKAFQQTGFNLLTMQQTGPDVRLLPEVQGPLPLITPLCEQAKSLMEGQVQPKTSLL